jgi:hypothetical protein
MEKITEEHKEARQMVKTAMQAVELLRDSPKCPPSCPLLTDHKDIK